MDERKERVVKGADSFVDERGKIDNYVLPEPVNWIGMITSRAGALRANHYHPVQEQKVLLVRGSFVSVYRDLNDPEAETRHHLVEAGDLVITPPNVAHTMLFREDSTFLNLVNGERQHENFGKHTIPYELVKPGQIEDYLKQYRGKD